MGDAVRQRLSAYKRFEGTEERNNGRDRDRTDDLYRVKVALIPTELRAPRASHVIQKSSGYVIPKAIPFVLQLEGDSTLSSALPSDQLMCSRSGGAGCAESRAWDKSHNKRLCGLLRQTWFKTSRLHVTCFKQQPQSNNFRK